MRIRAADPDTDAGAIADIYAVTGIATVASLEELAPDADAMASRIRTVADRFPWLVAELDGVVAGWCAVVPYSRRAAYRGVGEESVYVAERARGLGVGRALLSALIASAREGGLWTLQAGIFRENGASLALHRSLGFRDVGVRERIGQLNGAWRDVVLLELRL